MGSAATDHFLLPLNSSFIALIKSKIGVRVACDERLPVRVEAYVLIKMHQTHSKISY